jgi:hypothetical protein
MLATYSVGADFSMRHVDAHEHTGFVQQPRDARRGLLEHMSASRGGPAPNERMVRSPELGVDLEGDISTVTTR